MTCKRPPLAGRALASLGDVFLTHQGQMFGGGGGAGCPHHLDQSRLTECPWVDQGLEAFLKGVAAFDERFASNLASCAELVTCVMREAHGWERFGSGTTISGTTFTWSVTTAGTWELNISGDKQSSCRL